MNIMKKKKEVDELQKINNKHEQKIQGLGKELEENKKYFNDYEKNRIKTQEKINKLNKLNDGLNKEKQEIEKN